VWNWLAEVRGAAIGEIARAGPVSDPQRQISHKFLWMPERLISAIGMEWVSSERVVQDERKARNVSSCRRIEGPAQWAGNDTRSDLV
jgi:hypothetical protein